MGDEDDGGADWWQQQELEARQQLEEEALARSRLLLEQLREGNRKFSDDMNELNERIKSNWREFHGNHG